jgi:DNA-binding NtrC family response regulator
VSAEFLEALQQLKLPGNVRQLENLVRQALVRRSGDCQLGLHDLPAEALEQLSASTGGTTQAEATGGQLDPDVMAAYVVRWLETNGWNLSRLMERCERHALVAAMHRTGGNQSRAARLLGITPRSVYNKVHKHRAGEGSEFEFKAACQSADVDPANGF